LKLSESLAGFILGVICLGAGLYFAYAGQRDSDLDRLEKSGKRVLGSLVHKSERESTSARRGGQTVVKTYHFQLLYTVDARLITKEFEVTESAFRMHPSGSKVEVAYDPAEPETTDIAGGLSARQTGSQWVRSAVFIVLGVLLLGYGVYAKRKALARTPAS